MAEKLRVDVTKLSMRELWNIKEKINRSVMVEFNTRGIAAFDEEMAVALIWTVRHRTEPDLTFEEVFETLDLEQLGEVELNLDGPPARAASSEIAPKNSRRSRGSTGQARREPSTP